MIPVSEDVIEEISANCISDDITADSQSDLIALR